MFGILLVGFVGIRMGECAQGSGKSSVVLTSRTRIHADEKILDFILEMDPQGIVVGGMTFSVAYEEARFRFMKFEKSKATQKSLVVHKTETELIRFGFIDMQGLATKGELFTLRFSIHDTAKGNGRISVQKVTCSDNLGNLVPVRLENQTARP